MVRLLIILAAALAIALVLQAGLVAYAMYVLIGLLILSRFLAKRWVAGIQIKRESHFAEPVMVGDSVEVRIKIANAGTVGVTWVLVEDLFPEHYLRQKPPRVRITGRRIRLCSLGPGKFVPLKYEILCDYRGYYQIGPTLLETGDVFGLHRRHRIVSKPIYLMVLPKVIPLPKYDFSSKRPIGEVNSAHRLFEDPTRNAGIRPYQTGDPLQRVHWRATARTGELQCRIYDPTTLAGATILIDFHKDGYPSRGEPFRSDLAVTTACSIAYAVTMLNQQIGLASNGRDMADLYRYENDKQGNVEEATDFVSRDQARAEGEADEQSNRLRPVTVPTRRGIETFQQIREALARLELTDGSSFASMVLEVTPRLPRDATAIAILPDVSIETAMTLGNLKRQGFAVTGLLIGITDDEKLAVAAGRLMAEGIRDIRHVNSEDELALLGDQAPASGVNPYKIAVALA